MSAHARHDELSRRFVMDVVAETKSYSEMMVVIESTILATMMTLEKRHGFDKRGASAMVESAVHAAIGRFAEAGTC